MDDPLHVVCFFLHCLPVLGHLGLDVGQSLLCPPLPQYLPLLSLDGAPDNLPLRVVLAGSIKGLLGAAGLDGVAEAIAKPALESLKRLEVGSEA